MKSTKIAAALGLLIVAGVAQPAFATILYDNLGVASDGTTTGTPIADVPLFASFSTGAAPTSLADVKLQLDTDPYVYSSSGAGSLTIALFSDAGTAPGTLLTYIAQGVNESVSSSTTVDFTLSSLYNLAANTRYWIKLVSTPSSTLSWDWNQDIGGTGVASEFSYYAGAAYDNPTYGPYEMRVTTVPEPASMTILGIGLAGLLARRRRMI